MTTTGLSSYFHNDLYAVALGALQMGLYRNPKMGRMAADVLLDRIALH